MCRWIVKRVCLQSEDRQSHDLVSDIPATVPVDSSSDACYFSFASIEGLCGAIQSQSSANALSSDNNIRCVILFDNEEVSSPFHSRKSPCEERPVIKLTLASQVGSVSHHGAESDLLPSFVERIVALPDFSHVGYHQMLANSFLISADMGHAVSPH